MFSALLIFLCCTSSCNPMDSLPNTEIHLNHEQSQKLQTILQDDASYTHEITKSCLFVPEYLIRFDNSENYILLSPSCKQIKFMPEGKIRDIDPAFNAIKKLIQKG